MHWCCIKISIDYEACEQGSEKNTIVNILFDDPYGAGHFPSKLQEQIKQSVKTYIEKLIRKQNKDDDYNLDENKIKTIEKKLDQQGYGSNSWDCGPITFCNIEDYVQHITKGYAD